MEKSMRRKVNRWVDEVWVKAEKSWITRSQDHNYRDYVVRPALKKAISKLERVTNGLFVDVGCGDGGETFYLRRILYQFDWFGEIHGFDKQKNLIYKANQRTNKHSVVGWLGGRAFPITFDYGRINKLTKKYSLGGKVDLVQSLFAFQEVPYLRNFVLNISDMLKPGGVLLSVITHPHFEDVLKKEGSLRVNRSLKGKEWQYCAEYPIVEEGGSFYVPVFHRNLSDYLRLLEKEFYVEEVQSLKPSKKVVSNSKKRNILPFCDKKNNVYFPHINHIPSSVLLVARKK